MATMAHSFDRLVDFHSHPVLASSAVVLFWALAAAVVATTRLRLDAVSPFAANVAAAVSIVAVSGLYSRLCACENGGRYALLVGAAWLLFAVAAEVIVTLRTGQQWFALIGSPSHPYLRNLTMFVWLFAPALFARREVIS